MQLGLLDRRPDPAEFAEEAVRRHWLDDEAWIDHGIGWFLGAHPLFVELERTLRWELQERWMYERRVAVPRLLGRKGDQPLPAVVERMRQALAARYATTFVSTTFALYRDGQDSVAWHRDRDLRDRPEAAVAIVSLGGPRRFCVRPLGGGPSQSFSVGWGDLLVMGGAAQRTWEHCVPKVAHAEPRMAVMFRERWIEDGTLAQRQITVNTPSPAAKKNAAAMAGMPTSSHTGSPSPKA